MKRLRNIHNYSPFLMSGLEPILSLAVIEGIVWKPLISATHTVCNKGRDWVVPLTGRGRGAQQALWRGNPCGDKRMQGVRIVFQNRLKYIIAIHFKCRTQTLVKL